MPAPDALWNTLPFARSLPLPEEEQPTVITIEDDGNVVPFPGNAGNTRIWRTDDGGAVVDLSDAPARNAAGDDFSENLAIHMDGLDLSRLSEDLLEGIDADMRSREEWITNRDRGVDLLGLKIEKARTGPGGGGASLEGMSTAKDPALLEAVIRGQANAIGEFLPAEGPVKIEDVGDVQKDDLAELLEKDFNYFLTDVATEYYPDTKQMFAWVYFGGSGFKKVYRCPIRKRPVSESVDAKDLVVSNAATDMMNADRVTHILEMRKSEYRRMVVEGFYREDVVSPTPTPGDQTRLDLKLEEIEGVRADRTRPEDQPYTIYECRCECELDWDPFIPKKFKNQGVPLPYSVSIEKDSRRIVAIYRDWRQEDEEANRRQTFVKFSYIDWMGFYAIGLLHIIGNLTMALTAMLRISIDRGMLSNFPGGLTAKLPGQKQPTNELIAGPGQFPGVDMQGLDDIRKVVMALPYSDVTQGFLVLVEKIREFTKQLGGTADMPVGEGKADIPVGTILAIIEQATKVESSVHKGMHKATCIELELMIELFREDPEALYRYQKKAKRKGGTTTWNEALVLQALNDYDLVPRSDPNTPSHLHRVMKAAALWQMATTAPGVFNTQKIATQILSILGYKDTANYLAPPDPNPQPSPDQIKANAAMIGAQAKQQEVQTKVQTATADAQMKQQQMQNDQSVADTNLAKELVIHARDSQKAQADAAASQAEASAKISQAQADAGSKQQELGLKERIAHADATHKQQDLGLKALKTHADIAHKHVELGHRQQELGLQQAEHQLGLRQHALDATQAAHSAEMDVAGLNKPQEGTGE